MSSPISSDPSGNRGFVLNTVAISSTGVAVVVMATRLWVRGHIIRNFGYDDWIMALTTVVSLLGMGLVIAEVANRGGRHMGDVPAEQAEKALMLNFLSQLVYLWGICFAKISIGTSLLRIASTKFWKHLILVFMILVGIYTSVGFATLLAQCTDIRIIWNPSTKATCWPGEIIRILGYINFSLNIVSDLVLAIGIPLPMLWNINVSKRTKMSLFFIFGLGCFATACAIVRITYLPTYGVGSDSLWSTVDLTTWSILELNVSIIAGSLPSLRPLFKKFLGTVYGSGSRMKTYYRKGGSASRISKKNTRWQPYHSSDGKNFKNTKPMRPLPTGSSVDDAGSKIQLIERMRGRGSSAESQNSFELFSYNVESRITAESSPSLSRKNTIGGGITKTTTTTVSYDDPRSV